MLKREFKFSKFYKAVSGCMALAFGLTLSVYTTQALAEEEPQAEQNEVANVENKVEQNTTTNANTTNANTTKANNTGLVEYGSTKSNGTFDFALRAQQYSRQKDVFQDVSSQSRWRYEEADEYRYAKGSPSQLLAASEIVPHHTLGIRVNRSLTDSFNFKLGCILQSAIPMFELKVNGLDVRLFDSLNSFVFARFAVDDNQEFSLRGELVGSSRIVFSPITRSQERIISDLFLQMREGSMLRIALLQGQNMDARVYVVPLSGFINYADQLLQSCQSYNTYFKGTMQYQPDYVTKEPTHYAPQGYSLLENNVDVVDPSTLVEETPKKAMPVEIKEPQKEEEVEIIPFEPGGGPVSIGPDGLPIGVNNQGSLGTASGPLQIGPDGKPIPNNNSNNNNTDNNNGVDIF